MNFEKRLSKSRVVRFLSGLKNNEGWWHTCLLLLIVGISLAFMLNHLGKFMSVDEPKWFNTRVPQLGYALLHFNPGLTYINDKPGILPAFLSLPQIAIDYLYTTLYNEAFFQGSFEDILFYWRLPIVIFNTAMLVLIYYYIKELINRDFAIICLSFIALNPILVGISQIVNPDATLWSTGLISLLTFFLYIKTNLRKYVYHSGFFLGLALLSKYFASIIYILFILIIILEYLLDHDLKIGHLYTRFYNYFIIVAISMAVFTIFLPATWVNPVLTFKRTIFAGILAPGYFAIVPGLLLLYIDVTILKGKILDFIREKRVLDHIVRFLSIIAIIYAGILLLNMFLNYPFFNLNERVCCIYASELPKWEVLHISIYDTIITNTPLILLTMSFLLITTAIKGPGFIKSMHLIKTNIIYSGIILVFIYIFGAAVGNYITGARYQVLLYPIYALITTAVILSLIKRETDIKYATVAIIIFNFIVLFQTSPFYLQYNNELNIHNAVVTEPWGFGGYELAEKINAIPEYKSMHIWADREGFKGFFKGYNYSRNNYNPFINPDINYLALTSGGRKILLQAMRKNASGHPINPGSFPYSVEEANALLEYYNRTPTIEIIVNNNPNTYVKLIRFDGNK